jgi:hypothetical protein
LIEQFWARFGAQAGAGNNAKGWVTINGLLYRRRSTFDAEAWSMFNGD